MGKNRILIECDVAARRISYSLFDDTAESWRLIDSPEDELSRDRYTKGTVEEYAEEILECIHQNYDVGDGAELVFRERSAEYGFLSAVIQYRFSGKGLSCVVEPAARSGAAELAVAEEPGPGAAARGGSELERALEAGKPGEAAEEVENLQQNDADGPATLLPYEEIWLTNILQIGKGEEQKYQHKIIHFQSRINCEGSLKFEDCVLHYGEKSSVAEMQLGQEASLTMEHCVVEGHSGEKWYFINADFCKKTIRFTDCRFVRCSYFLKGGIAGCKCSLKRCCMYSPGGGFLSGGFQSLDVTAQECQFWLGSREGKRKDPVIACRDIQLENCTVNGHAGFQGAEDCEAWTNSEEFKSGVSYCAVLECEKGSITKSSFAGVVHLCSSRGSVKVSLSVFERCLDVFQGQAGKIRLIMEDCRLDCCSNIACNATESLVQNNQFNRCFWQLIETDFSGGVKILYCQFNNWVGGRDMLRFNRQTDGHYNILAYCEFRGIDAGSGFVVMANNLGKIEDCVVKISHCAFLNCRTSREKGQLFWTQGSYHKPVTKKRVEITITSVFDCRGLDRVNKGACQIEKIDPKMVGANHVPLGADFGELKAGILQALPEDPA